MAKGRLLQTLVFSVILFVFLGCARTHLVPSIGMPNLQSTLDFKPLKPEVWKLSNGVKVVFINDPELPLVRGSLVLPKGTLWEMNGKRSLVAAMGYLMRQGGAAGLSADTLDLELEKLAANISSGYSAEYGTVGFSCLSSDFERVFSIFADVVKKPRFEKERIDLWKGQSLESIRRRTDDPGTVAGIAFKELLFGDNVFGGTTTSEDVKAITREDLIVAHEQFVVPGGAVLAVVGDIDREKLASAAESIFGKWQSNVGNSAVEPVFNFNPTPGIYFISQPLEQATVYIGQHGPARLPNDYVAIEAFNNIFGSGDFGARLIKVIRTELGLAYSLYGAVVPGFMKGQNVIVIQTKNATVSQATRESLKILGNMQENLVESGELIQAKQAIQNSLVFKMDSPDDALLRHVLLELLKYPKDYDDTYMDKVSALSKEDVKKVASAYWDLSKLVVVVVGDEKAYTSIKSDLESSPNSYYNLPLKRCTFEEKLGSCS